MPNLKSRFLNWILQKLHGHKTTTKYLTHQRFKNKIFEVDLGSYRTASQSSTTRQFQIALKTELQHMSKLETMLRKLIKSWSVDVETMYI